jgi:hypothetical protein
MELLLITILALLAFLCISGEIRSLRVRRQADNIVRLRSAGRPTDACSSDETGGRVST